MKNLNRRSFFGWLTAPLAALGLGKLVGEKKDAALPAIFDRYNVGIDKSLYKKATISEQYLDMFRNPLTGGTPVFYQIKGMPSFEETMENFTPNPLIEEMTEINRHISDKATIVETANGRYPYYVMQDIPL